MTGQDEVTAIARRHAGEVLRCLAKIADGSGDADVKEDARRLLEKTLAQLKAIIDDPKAAPDLRQAALEARRQFLDS